MRVQHWPIEVSSMLVASVASLTILVMNFRWTYSETHPSDYKLYAQIYDYFLTLSREVEYIWKGHFSLVTLLFFTIRYLPFFDIPFVYLCKFDITHVSARHDPRRWQWMLHSMLYRIYRLQRAA